MAHGDAKYGRYNWQKGTPHTEVADSLMRHLLAWSQGQDLDPESGHLHADHVVANALFLAYFTRYRPEMDDRAALPDASPTAEEGSPRRAGAGVAASIAGRAPDASGGAGSIY